MEILVFKTNLLDTNRIRDVQPSLEENPAIVRWNVDLHDADHVLRVVSDDLCAAEVEKHLLKAGYYCEELK